MASAQHHAAKQAGMGTGRLIQAVVVSLALAQSPEPGKEFLTRLCGQDSSAELDCCAGIAGFQKPECSSMSDGFGIVFAGLVLQLQVLGIDFESTWIGIRQSRDRMASPAKSIPSGLGVLGPIPVRFGLEDGNFRVRLIRFPGPGRSQK
jgi:hypothetical protein